MIRKKSKLAEIVNKNAHLLPFLRRVGIELGFGDKTIEEICSEKKINLEFFIELLQLIFKKYEFNPKYVDNFETNLTIDYLRKSHSSYLNEYLPKIEYCIIELCNKELNRKEDTKILVKFFDNYKNDFRGHLAYEDTVIFPYILNIEKKYRMNESNKSIKDDIKDNTIKNYIKKHDSLNEQLNDLKNLLIKYFRPFDDELLTQSLLISLFELETDLKDHELIENQILFPQVRNMEQHLLSLNN